MSTPWGSFVRLSEPNPNTTHVSCRCCWSNSSIPYKHTTLRLKLLQRRSPPRHMPWLLAVKGRRAAAQLLSCVPAPTPLCTATTPYTHAQTTTRNHCKRCCACKQRPQQARHKTHPTVGADQSTCRRSPPWQPPNPTYTLLNQPAKPPLHQPRTSQQAPRAAASMLLLAAGASTGPDSPHARLSASCIPGARYTASRLRAACL